MIKFLQRLLLGNDESILRFMRDELKMLREQLVAKDRQIEQLQAQVGSVLSFQYDRPKIVQEIPESKSSMPIDTFNDVNSVDDEEFVKALEKAAYSA